MNVENVRSYCLKKPFATEDFPFDETNLVFRICGKIFACLPLDGSNILQLKCDPEYAIELRDRYDCITGAWHWNKKYWNQLPIGEELSEHLICSLIDHAYTEVVKKLTRKQRMEIGLNIL